MATYREIADAVKSGNRKSVQALVQEMIDAGSKAEEILNQGLVVGMNELGEAFSKNEVFVPEVLIAARAMKAGTALIKPMLMAENVQSLGTVAIGTVQGDLHDIGKNLVGMMLEGAGFTVVDLGTDVAPEQFVAAVKEQGVNVIGMSALLTTTMTNMKAVIDLLNEQGLRGQVKVMIGGAPITQEFADEIGADGYSSDAASAAVLAKKLVGAVA